MFMCVRTDALYNVYYTVRVHFPRWKPATAAMGKKKIKLVESALYTERYIRRLRGGGLRGEPRGSAVICVDGGPRGKGSFHLPSSTEYIYVYVRIIYVPWRVYTHIYIYSCFSL